MRLDAWAQQACSTIPMTSGAMCVAAGVRQVLPMQPKLRPRPQVLEHHQRCARERGGHWQPGLRARLERHRQRACLLPRRGSRPRARLLHLKSVFMPCSLHSQRGSACLYVEEVHGQSEQGGAEQRVEAVCQESCQGSALSGATSGHTEARPLTAARACRVLGQRGQRVDLPGPAAPGHAERPHAARSVPGALA